MSGDEVIDWASLLSSLCHSANSKSGKISIRLLDSIFFNEFNDESSTKTLFKWYFTTKSGYISHKKHLEALDANCVNDIVDRFSRFALANPNNNEQIVGVFVHGNGSFFHSLILFACLFTYGPMTHSLGYRLSAKNDIDFFTRITTEKYKITNSKKCIFTSLFTAL